MRVCEVSTVRKISDYQAEGPGLNSARLGVELWTTFFRHTVGGQGCQDVGLVSQRSIGGLKRTHTLVDKSRLMPVLWTVTPPPFKGTPLVECNLCGKPPAVYGNLCKSTALYETCVKNNL